MTKNQSPNNSFGSPFNFRKSPAIVDPRVTQNDEDESSPSSCNSSSDSNKTRKGDITKKRGEESKRKERIVRQRIAEEQEYKERRKHRRFRPGTVAIREIKEY